MDFIIVFFRDILDGPLYTVITVICSILICACIGYLAEKRQKQKEKKEQYVEVSPEAVAVSSTMPHVPSVSATLQESPQVMQTPVSSQTVSPAISASPTPGPMTMESTASGISGVVEDTRPVGPVQIDKPQVVAIPVSDQQGAQLSQPQEVLPTNQTSPSSIPSMQVTPTAPSVPTTPVVPSEQTSIGVPTSVNKS